MTGFGGSRIGQDSWGGGSPPEPEGEFADTPYAVPPGQRYGRVPVSRFSGEPRQGLLSGADGLLFFSPALLVPSSSSEMELADISVKAVAADVYGRPVERSRRLFKFGGGASSVPGVVTGSNTLANVDTTSAFTLAVRAAPYGDYVLVDVTQGASTPKSGIVNDLNSEFALASLDLVATLVGSNQVRITGPYVSVGSVSDGSTLNAVLGFSSALGAGWPSLTNSALYRSQPREYSVVATLVQTTPPGPTTVINIS